ncbi:MAG: lactonase family protein [Phycisphaeraceae bacterium]
MTIWMLALICMVAGLAVASLTDAAGRDADRVRVYLGTASQERSKGIYLAELDLTSGQLSEPELVAEVEGPTFLVAHPTGRWLYSVGTTTEADGTKVGVVHSFAVNRETGALTWLNQQPSGGDGPCHLSLDPAGRHALVANYSSGSVAVLPIDEEGQLGPASSIIQHTGSSVHPRRQQQPHAHAIQPHPAGGFAFVADLGADRLVVYRYDDQTGGLDLHDAGSFDAAPGAGPRHFAFHPTLNVIYLINELDSTVAALRFDASAGRLEALQTVTTLPDDFQDVNYPSEVAVHPAGRFLYGANRGHDSLAVFEISGATGELALTEIVPIEGDFPRHFAIDPTGQFLIAAHQKSNDLSIFRLDPDSGRPAFTGQQVPLGTAMCVLYQPMP